MGRRRYDDYDSGYSSGRRRYTRSRRNRRMEERRIETITFAMIIVLFAMAILYQGRINNLAAWLSVGGGAILLGSAIYQSQRRWRVNPTTWVGGTLMLAAGLLALNGTSLPFGIYMPMLIFGGVILVSFLTGEI